jgi:hypothetical protein
MERLPNDHHEREKVAMLLGSDWMNDGLMMQRLAERTTNLRSVPAGDVTCEALHLALSALHIDMAWHAGVMSAEVAMEDLHRAVARASRSCQSA